MNNSPRIYSIIHRIGYLSAILTFTLWLLTPVASAAPISGTGSPLDAIPGGTVIDFSTMATTNYPNMTIGNVIFDTTHEFWISDVNGGSFNTTGRHLESKKVWQIKFDFLAEVDAFAFNLGGHDTTWTLTGYSSSGSQIGALVINAIGSSNQGQYYGLAAAGISRAELTTTLSNDYILLDNFTYDVSVVPIPAALPLFLSGLAGLGFLARRRKKQTLKKASGD